MFTIEILLIGRIVNSTVDGGLLVMKTKLLKIAVYHYSSSNPAHQGCAAHGSDTEKALKSAPARLT